MFWKLFGSEKKLQEAVDQLIVYDISPESLNMPANSDVPNGARAVNTLKKLELETGATPDQKKKA